MNFAESSHDLALEVADVHHRVAVLPALEDRHAPIAGELLHIVAVGVADAHLARPHLAAAGGLAAVEEEHPVEREALLVAERLAHRVGEAARGHAGGLVVGERLGRRDHLATALGLHRARRPAHLDRAVAADGEEPRDLEVLRQALRVRAVGDLERHRELLGADAGDVDDRLRRRGECNGHCSQGDNSFHDAYYTIFVVRGSWFAVCGSGKNLAVGDEAAGWKLWCREPQASVATPFSVSP